MKKFLLWFRIIRPQTLFASIVPVLVGLRATAVSGTPAVARHPEAAAILTVICALSLQILSNLINDYYDFKRGCDKAGRAGFKRALAEGEVNEKQLLTACGTALAAAILTGAYPVLVGGPVILAIGVTAIIFAWLYTATRHSLSYLGIADIFVFLYYGVIASCGTAYLQTHAFLPEAFHAGAVCGLISMCVLMTNNLRDIDGDREAGKRTLPVRFGKKAAQAVLLVEILLIPFFAWKAWGWSAPMLTSVAALVLYAAILRAEGAQYNKCLLCTGLVNVLYLILCLF